VTAQLNIAGERNISSENLFKKMLTEARYFPERDGGV
jgi:hypothetical protein